MGTTATKKMSREDAEQLKRNWLNDPCFDLYGWPEFAEFEEELRAFQLEQEQQWALDAEIRLREGSAKAGIPDNLALFAYIRGLERRIEQLEKERE